jgi:uncharacterized protein (TIGR02246 family)
MTHLFLMAFSIAICSTSFSAPPPQDALAQALDKDRAAIQQTVTDFLNAWNQHDARAFAMVFTGDADFTNVAGAHARGRSSIEAFHAPLFAGVFKDSHQTATIRNVRFLTPDLAAVDVDWDLTGAKSVDGVHRPPRKGLLNWLMARQGDGSWLIEVMHNTELTTSLSAQPSK